MQINLEPRDYRARDPETGRWRHNVDRRLCRWMGIAALLWIAYLWWRVLSGEDGGIWLVPAVAMPAFAAGGLIVLSLKSIDW